MTYRFFYPDTKTLVYIIAPSINIAADKLTKERPDLDGASCKAETYTIERGWRSWENQD